MFPDNVLTRVALRLSIFCLDAIAPFCALWLFLALLLYPTPPLILSYFPVDRLIPHDLFARLFTYWSIIETSWWLIHRIGRTLVARGYWDYRGEVEEISTEERWRLWVTMVESTEDPWEWIAAVFLVPGAKAASRGASDPNILRVKLQDVGRTNVEEFITHFLMQKSLQQLDSVEKAELHSMVLLLEAGFNRTRPGFKFPRGRSRHGVLLINDQPIVTSHHPLLFYISIWICSCLGNSALYFAGFRYYGPKTTWPFPLFFTRGSRRALEAVQDPTETARMGDSELADSMGYWYWPGSKEAQESSLTPIIFFHGISGTYGPTPFIIFIARLTGRPMFLPELPYVSMRLSPPSSIRTRVHMVAAARRMLWRHGFGVTWPEDSDSEEEDWRRGRAVIVGHSLGGGPCGWMLRDAGDVVAGVVLIDPMSTLLWCADAPRNFFRKRCATAGEMFFRYFAAERGICHFLSRHQRWNDSVIFGPRAPAPLSPVVIQALVPKVARREKDPLYDRPNYAQYCSPSPFGPFPTKIFLSEDDCILPVPKIVKYLLASGFDKEAVTVMPGEHAAVLLSPRWARSIAKAIDEVADAGERLLYEDE